MNPSQLLQRVERARALDSLTDPLHHAVHRMLPNRAVTDVLHGVPLGHPLHPMLTDVTIGAWTSATLLDFLPGTGTASGTLTLVGLASAGPTSLSGLTDWASLNPDHQRVGLVHATANVLALGLYAASLWTRLRGRRFRARALSLAGFGVLGVGGYVGGHLSFRQSAGANHTEDLPNRFPSGWQPLGPLAELPDGEAVRRIVAGTELFVYRRDELVHVLADRCSHLSGPLSEGEVRDGAAVADACVVCPWHASTFRLRDGAVVHGPATAPQPVFDTRVSGGQVEVRLGG